MSKKIIFLAGSIRKKSYNQMLSRQAFEIAKEMGMDAELINLADYEMPFYNGDLEAEKGLPEAALRLKDKFLKCEAFFIASPEYNGSFSALLKNSLDWISRPSNAKDQPCLAFAGKKALIASASPSMLGGLRGLVPLRMWLGIMNAILLPAQVSVAKAHENFSEDGKLKDGFFLDSLRNMIESVKNF